MLIQDHTSIRTTRVHEYYSSGKLETGIEKIAIHIISPFHHNHLSETHTHPKKIIGNARQFDFISAVQPPKYLDYSLLQTRV